MKNFTCDDCGYIFQGSKGSRCFSCRSRNIVKGYNTLKSMPIPRHSKALKAFGAPPAFHAGGRSNSSRKVRNLVGRSAAQKGCRRAVP